MNNLTDDDEISIHLEQDPLIGQTLEGKYNIVSIIGRGGMGVVYKAKHLTMDRFVAVKTLHIGKAGDTEAMRRFNREARAVVQVKHPHTVTLYDFGVSAEGQAFLVMEMLNGISLRQALKEGPLSLPRANEIFQQVVDALSCAHAAGIVHKDLKPENIMLSERSGFGTDWVHVLDFGISAMSSSLDRQYGTMEPREVVGSPPYMSPEQCAMTHDIDQRSDIYALGVCLFEALSGTFPFKARTAMEMLDCHLSRQPRLLREIGIETSTYESVTQLISKALEKKPGKRHDNIKQFGLELEEAVQTDSKRGMALKHRITMELPRTAEFADLNRRVIDELEEEDDDDAATTQSKRGSSFGRQKGSALDQLKNLFTGDVTSKEASKADTDKIIYFQCPHCGTDTQPELSLCLCCGRSLATKDDFSKLRAARRDFSLPRQKTQTKESAKFTRTEFGQRAKAAMLNTGRAWTRSVGLIFLGVILIVCVFVASGGYQLVKNYFNQPPQPPAPSSD